jgi:hypothetical protein
VLLAFVVVTTVMVVMTLYFPLVAAKKLPEREDIKLETKPIVYIAGTLVTLGVLAFFIAFW